jgi:hypothetical protein
MRLQAIREMFTALGVATTFGALLIARMRRLATFIPVECNVIALIMAVSTLLRMHMWPVVSTFVKAVPSNRSTCCNKE